MEIKLLDEADVKQVSCAACYAIAGDLCRVSNKPGAAVRQQRMGIPLSQFHDNRIMLAWRKRYACEMPSQLDHAKRAEIVYRAFVRLCDAVSAEAETFYGRAVHPAQIQAEFVAVGVDDLMKEETKVN